MGSSIGVLHEAFKIAHTYTSLTKNFYGFETVFALWFCDFLHIFMCVLCRAKILPQIYTRIITSLKPPPYTRIICEKNFAPDIYENCGAFEICVSDWLSIGIFAFVCIMFCICGHCLKSVVFLIGRCQILVVKMW